MRSSSKEDGPVVKQCSSEEDEPVVQPKCRDPEEAVVMQQCGDEVIECPGLHHLGQNKKELPTHYDSIIR